MRRVVENLLSNAVKYGAPNTPIEITVRRIDSKMVLTVHNQGEPISKEEQSKLFEPFARGKNAQQTEKAGWGIGLTLIRGIIDAHGGSIRVESTAEGGTTFTIINPMDSRPYQSAEQ